MKTKKRILAYLLTLTLAMTSLPTQLFAQTTNDLPLPMSALVDTQTTTPGAIQINPNKYVGDGYEVEFKVTNQWPGAFNGEFVLTNTSDKPLENWTLKFDFGHEITNMWNAQILTHENSNYIIKNMGWNQDIEPGSSVTIGFQANSDGTINNPSKYSLDMEEQVASDVGYTIGYKLTNNWNTGFNGEISITNQSKVPIEDWSLAFDFEANINNLWTATIVEHTGNHYVIKNKGYNANIAPGQTLTLGFGGDNLKDSAIEPSNYKLSYIGSAKDKEEIDYELDTDKDDLPDYYENILGTDPLNADTDGDGLPDGYEYWELMTDPLLQDSDGNNISDADEDFDEDGLTNKEEFLLDTDPYNNDTDEDGLLDGDEVNKFNTNPLVYDEIDENLDTDQDGLVDGLEMRLGTEFNNPDTDGDGLLDGYEVFKIGTNPLEVDSNNNGINDGDEDFDQDGLSNLEEQKLGTDPQVADTDRDNLSDGDEVNQYYTDPLLYDTDGDTIGDGDEIKLGLNPLATSTNGVLDNEYMIEQTASEEALTYINTEDNAYKLSIDMKASGNAADNIMVSTSQYANSLSSNDAIVGKTISVDYYTGKIEKGTLSFKINQSTIEEATQEGLINSDAQGLEKFYVFNFNEELNMLVPVPTTYDQANDTLVSDLVGEGTYCVMNVEKWLVNIGALEDTTNIQTNDYSMSSALLSHKNLSSPEQISPMAVATDNNIMPLNKAGQKKVDLVFVIDTGYTMKPMLASVKKGIKDIVNFLKSDNLDVEVCIIDVKDVNQINSPQVIQINGTPAPQAEGNRTLSFTNDANQIESIVDNLVAEGGYDYFTLGTQMAGVAYTTTLPFRNGANKFVLLITDKSTGIKNYHGYSSTFALLDDLKAKNISFSASSMNRDLGGSIPDNTVQSYRRYISRGNGIFVPLRNFDFEINLFTDFVVTNLIEQKEFTILGNTDLEEIILDEPLVKGGQTDSDGDRLTDSEEVDWSYYHISYTSNGYELPTLQNLWFDIDKGYDYDIEDFPFSVEYSQIKVLPILSHPKKIDSDDDGLTDYEDSMPFKNDFIRSWVKATKNGIDNYIGFIKNGDEYLRRITYDAGTSNNQRIYRFENEEWVLSEGETLPISKETLDAEINDGKVFINAVTNTAIIGYNTIIDTAQSLWLSPYNPLRENEDDMTIEDRHAEAAGIMTGVIDSLLHDENWRIPIYSNKGNVVFRVSLLPSNTALKKAMLATAGDSEYLLEKNEYYLRAKFHTEIALIVAHGIKGKIGFEMGSKLITQGLISSGASGGITALASGLSVATGVVLIADATSEAVLIAQTVGIATGDNEKLKKVVRSKVEEKISKAAKKFGNFECVPCAEKIKGIIKKNKMKGRQINLTYKDKNGFIWSDTANKTISENGFHTAIEFNGKVYDNIHTDGIEYEKWVKDFLGNGERTIEFTDF